MNVDPYPKENLPIKKALKIDKKKSPVAYVVERLIGQFIKFSTVKLQKLLTLAWANHVTSFIKNREIELSALFKEGADKSFDQLLVSLGTVGTHRPETVLEAIIGWRKTKTDLVEQSVQKQIKDNPNHKVSEITTFLKERKTISSNLILCRALCEILKQIPDNGLSEKSGKQLEDMIFLQIKNAADGDKYAVKSNRHAQLEFFSELVGALSRLRFASVSDRFISELEKCKKNPFFNKDEKLEGIIQAMNKLELKIYPLENLEMTVEFLKGVASLFVGTNSTILNQSYSILLESLLSPIAGIAEAEVNLPLWMDFVNLVFPNATKLIVKPKSWMYGFPLVTTILAVSRKDFFLRNWWFLFETCGVKLLKDKGYRMIALSCMCKLLWVYLKRCPETIPEIRKRLDSATKMLFPYGKEYIISIQPFRDLYVRILFIIGMNNFSFALEEIFIPMLAVDTITSNTGSEVNAGERMATVIRAFAEIDRAVREKEVPSYFGDKLSYKMAPKVITKQKKNSNDTPDVESSVLAELSTARDKISFLLAEVLRYIDQTSMDFLLTEHKEAKVSISSMSTTTQLQNTLTGNSDIMSVPGYPPNLIIQVPKDKAGIFYFQKVAFEHLSTIRPKGLSTNYLSDVLCNYMVHIDQHVRIASMEALVVLAKSDGSEHILRKLGRFIVNIEDRFVEVISGNINILNTASSRKGLLDLYIDILGLWIYDLTQEINRSFSEEDKEKNDKILNINRLNEEIEAIGLLFLCSSSCHLRTGALKILKLASVAQRLCLDVISTGDDKNNLFYTVNDILETAGQELIKKVSKVNQFSDTTRSIIDNQMTNSTLSLHSILTSESQKDFSLWSQIFPSFIQLCYEKCSPSVTLCFNVVCTRVSRLYSYISYCSELPRSAMSPAFSMSAGITLSRSSVKGSFADFMISTWKLYLSFICSCLPILKTSRTLEKSRLNILEESVTINDFHEFMQKVFPFLYCDNTSVRHALVNSLGNIHSFYYNDLLRYLRSPIQSVIEEMKSRLGGKTTTTSKKGAKKAERLRTEIAHVLFLIADFVKNDESIEEKVIEMVRNYLNETLLYLTHPDIQQDWDHQMLRYYYSGLIERIYYNLSKSRMVPRLINFQMRVKMFKLLEEWCGHGQHSAATREREAKMMFHILDQVKNFQERGALNSILEEQRKALELAALKAMAELCKGPISIDLNLTEFDIAGVLKWIHSVFNSPDERLHVIAKSSIEALLLYNQQYLPLSREIFQQCFYNEPQLAKGSFQAVVSVYTKSKEFRFSYPQLIALGLFKLADDDIVVRKDAIILLRSVQNRSHILFRLDDYEMAISSYLNLSYLQAQLSISEYLATSQPQLNYIMLVEFAKQLDQVYSKDKSKIFNSMLPWTERLSMDVKPYSDTIIVTDETYDGLKILFYLTAKYSSDHYFQLKDLWISLLKKDKDVGFQIILNFLIEICLEFGNSLIVDQARIVLLFLAKELSDDILIDSLLQEFQPNSFVPLIVQRVIQRENQKNPDDGILFDRVLQKPQRSLAMSRGQIGCIFLADLLSELSKNSVIPHLSIFLHIAILHIDHKQSIFVDQCRTLLARLTQFLIATKVRDKLKISREKELLDKLRSLESTRIWNYDDIVPFQSLPASVQSLNQFVNHIVGLFESISPTLRVDWGELALWWATSSLSRHSVGRSFQVFRTLVPPLKEKMVLQIIVRLANLIGDASEEAQGISLEALLTLRSVIECTCTEKLLQFPQIFWCGIACLYTVHEYEYLEAVHILSALFEKLDLRNPIVRQGLFSNMPEHMKSEYAGIQPLLLRGLTSATLSPNTLSLLNKTALIRGDPLIDNSEAGMLFCLLANLPRLLKGFDENPLDPMTLVMLQDITTAVKGHQLAQFESLFQLYSGSRFRNSDEFLAQFMLSIKKTYFPQYEPQTLLFLIGTLANNISWHRGGILRVLKAFIPHLDTSQNSQLFRVEEMLVPLYKLTQSEFSEQVLDLLESFMKLADKVSANCELEFPEPQNDPWSTKRFTTMMALEQEMGWSVTHAGQWVKMTRYNLKAIIASLSQQTTLLTQEKHTLALSISTTESSTTDLVESPLKSVGFREEAPHSDLEDNSGKEEDIVNVNYDFNDIIDEHLRSESEDSSFDDINIVSGYKKSERVQDTVNIKSELKVDGFPNIEKHLLLNVTEDDAHELKKSEYSKEPVLESLSLDQIESILGSTSEEEELNEEEKELQIKEIEDLEKLPNVP